MFAITLGIWSGGARSNKFASWVEWQNAAARLRIVEEDGTIRTVCDQCRERAKKRNIETHCETCRVDLLPENKDAAEVFMMTRNQVVTAGMGQIIDINIQTVKTVMDLLRIKNQLDCLEKVRKVFHYFQEKNSDEN